MREIENMKKKQKERIAQSSTEGDYEYIDFLIYGSFSPLRIWFPKPDVDIWLERMAEVWEISCDVYSILGDDGLGLIRETIGFDDLELCRKETMI